jgi:hypothetical protein
VKHVAAGFSSTMLPAVPLDDVLAFETRPVYIKIDIEGAECNALKGARSYISKSTNIIGMNMEFFRIGKKCCAEWTMPGGFFDVLHKKHNLCPVSHAYATICSAHSWDLLWEKCSALQGRAV